MSEIVERVEAIQEMPSNSKTNVSLTLGIIGTTLGALSLMGRAAHRGGILGPIFGGGGDCGAQATTMSPEDLYIERTQCVKTILI